VKASNLTISALPVELGFTDKTDLISIAQINDGFEMTAMSASFLTIEILTKHKLLFILIYLSF